MNRSDGGLRYGNLAFAKLGGTEGNKARREHDYEQYVKRMKEIVEEGKMKRGRGGRMKGREWNEGKGTCLWPTTFQFVELIV
jgi:hypothetical protein